MKISLCMIVKNEQEVLARCLESAKACVDEIVIADTGSTDDTKTIARRYTDKIFSYPWKDDFAAARNFVFSKAQGDYLIWLDADDIIAPKSVKIFPLVREFLKTHAPDMLMCPYDIAFDRSGNVTSTFYRERFLKRSANFQWEGRVHECIAPRGKVMKYDWHVQHLGSEKKRGARNLNIYRKWAEEQPLNGRDKFYYGRELYYHHLYTEAIAVLSEMLEGDGWYVNKIEACKTLAYCYGARGDSKAAFSALLKSFCYGEPRASVLCELGYLLKREKRLKEAAFWFESALRCRDHAQEGDFEEPNCRTLIPLLELVCIYYHLGDTARALDCHRQAEKQFPNHPSVLYNKKFFESKKLI